MYVDCVLVVVLYQVQIELQHPYLRRELPSVIHISSGYSLKDRNFVDGYSDGLSVIHRLPWLVKVPDYFKSSYNLFQYSCESCDGGCRMHRSKLAY